MRPPWSASATSAHSSTDSPTTSESRHEHGEAAGNDARFTVGRSSLMCVSAPPRGMMESWCHRKEQSFFNSWKHQIRLDFCSSRSDVVVAIGNLDVGFPCSFIWRNIYTSEFESPAWKPKLATPPSPPAVKEEPHSAGSWKKKFFRRMREQDMEKWRKDLRKTCPHTSLPQQTEAVLR